VAVYLSVNPLKLFPEIGILGTFPTNLVINRKVETLLLIHPEKTDVLIICLTLSLMSIL
jgi:hypothetical protein